MLIKIPNLNLCKQLDRSLSYYFIELLNTWETRVTQYTPIWDVLNHSNQDIMEI